MRVGYGRMPNWREHGGYRHVLRTGCQFPECTLAERRYNTRYDADYARGVRRRVDATGTVRRIRALGVIGWSSRELAREVGLSASTVSDLSRAQNTVHKWRADLIRTHYERLEHTDGPSGRRCRAEARRAGGHAPADWDGLDMDDPDVWPEAFETRTWSCQWYKHSRCGGVRQLVTELGSEPAPCGCSCHETEEN